MECGSIQKINEAITTIKMETLPDIPGRIRLENRCPAATPNRSMAGNCNS